MKTELYRSFIKKIQSILRRLSLIELLLILMVMLISVLSYIIFKLAIAGTLTWNHIFWFMMFFG